MYAYVVVEFINNSDDISLSDDSEVDIVPHSWVITQTETYWPPFRNVKKAQIQGMTPDPTTWSTHKIKIVCAAGKV